LRPLLARAASMRFHASLTVEGTHMPALTRRSLLGAAPAAGLLLSGLAPAIAAAAAADGLQPMTGSVAPISRDERMARIGRAQALMKAQGLSALLLEPGSSMTYFTGVQWWRSERMTCAILPVEGEPAFVTPGFEEPSVRESLGVPGEVRVWQEDEDPLAVVAGILRDKKLARGSVGIEETVRFFIADGLARHLPEVKVVPGAPVVRPIRMVKTAHEIALMQMASDITIAAYRHVYPRVQKGMTRDELAAMIAAATRALGGDEPDTLVLLGEAAAYPHGSHKPQVVREGEVVLFDCGCAVQGYKSDISRSFVFGEASKHERQVWDQVHQGQQVAFEAAKVGAPCGGVDDAVRRYYGSLGYGPGYKLPGTPHRTGHGIGMDGHEPVNLVHGEMTTLKPGMCFSDEPGIYIPGAFGIRLEDCFHMTEAGPKWFSVPPPSIDKPFD
jgi:Xaa-Pro dipeptidase